MIMNNNEEILTCIEVMPNKPPAFTIIWMHGLGADGSDFVPVASELNASPDSNTRFIFPHAPIIPITINNGYEMRAWYDIVNFSIHTEPDNKGIAKSSADIGKLIEREVKRGIATDHIFLAGFSQGAAIALTTGLCYPEKLAGIIALSGYLPDAHQILKKASKANQHIPIFLAHGMEDPILPFSLGLNTRELLTEAGYPVDWHSYDMPHSVCPEEIRDINKWIIRQQ